MGSGAQSKLSEASAAEVASAYGELPSEAQKSLQEALKLLKAKTSGTLTCRSKLSGEVMATLDSSQTWTYKEMAAALREKLPETKTQVIKFFIGEEAIDEYRALSDMGFANGSGEVQCAISQFDFGTKMTLEEAQPILEDITEKLNGLSKAMIMEIKALKSPPHGIILVGEAVACLLQAPRASWHDLLKMFGAKDFMEQLVTFNKDEVPMESLVELQWYLNHPLLDIDRLNRVSAGAVCMMHWARGMSMYAMLKNRVS
ncbi:Dynein axonemal heavy chain 6 (Axonemal beta dynein heavy chain 6) (Ciliary dynein heavy chain 6) [Durusdinium trenchii]|uniref:Dynein axonemal heavy chain 6 (Axonemal beta dynein heavy chain 6) (Ciliary dynein heavy chain 6) n=1 Tax=Durusdinium trenchii TaxID=1381693 RepID=A0ABP0KTW5_9DINO